jgi:hypothetical protein
MRFIALMVMAGVGVLLYAPGLEAQVGDCMICDYELINPCTGSYSGAMECMQLSPGHCDVYGDACEIEMAALDITPAGSRWLPRDLRELVVLQLLAKAEGETREVRGCGEALLARSVPEITHQAVRHRTGRIVI